MSGIISMIPDKKNNTCIFEFDKGCFPKSEDQVYFSEEVYKQIRQGLVKARLNYTVCDLEATILEENTNKNTVTVRISAV